MTGDALEVWFVCTGNRFRSPLAAHVLARELDPGVATIRSRGTLDIGDAPVLPEALEISGPLGLDLDGHTARVLREGELVNADLVVGFERAHLGVAVELGHARRDCTFTLPELVWLLDATAAAPADGPRAAIAAAAAARDLGLTAWPLEIGDPLGCARERFWVVAHEIERLCVALAARLR